MFEKIPETLNKAVEILQLSKNFQNNAPASWIFYFKHLKPRFVVTDMARDNRKLRCLKSVRIRSFFGPHFSTFGLNTEKYGVSLRIQSECRKIRDIFPYSDQIRENTDQNNSEYGHFLGSEDV